MPIKGRALLVGRRELTVVIKPRFADSNDLGGVSEVGDGFEVGVGGLSGRVWMDPDGGAHVWVRAGQLDRGATRLQVVADGQQGGNTGRGGALDDGMSIVVERRIHQVRVGVDQAWRGHLRFVDLRKFLKYTTQHDAGVLPAAPLLRHSALLLVSSMDARYQRRRWMRMRSRYRDLYLWRAERAAPPARSLALPAPRECLTPGRLCIQWRADGYDHP